MIDENYKPVAGRLSDIDITWLCVGDKPMISPFVARQAGDISFGLSVSGYDFRLAANYLIQDEIIRFDGPVDPLNKEHQELQWIKKEAKDGIIVIRPLECILASTIETVDMPKDITAIVLGKSTMARNNVLANMTPLESGWKGRITIELHNCSPIYPVMLRVGQGIIQAVFDRMPNPPSRTYEGREVDGKYQGQVGPTTSR